MVELNDEEVVLFVVCGVCIECLLVVEIFGDVLCIDVLWFVDG